MGSSNQVVELNACSRVLFFLLTLKAIIVLLFFWAPICE